MNSQIRCNDRCVFDRGRCDIAAYRRQVDHCNEFENSREVIFSKLVRVLDRQIFCDLERTPSVGLAQAFMVATLIFNLRLRIAEAGHLAVFHQNLSGG